MVFVDSKIYDVKGGCIYMAKIGIREATDIVLEYAQKVGLPLLLTRVDEAKFEDNYVLIRLRVGFLKEGEREYIAKVSHEGEIIEWRRVK